MVWGKILNALQNGENETTAFENNIQSIEHLLKVLISLLNKKGGMLILGIDDKNGYLLGSNVSKSFIENSIQKIDPLPTIKIEEISRLNKSIYILNILNNNKKPYRYQGNYYYRNGTLNIKTDKEEIFSITGSTKISATKSKNKLNSRQEKIIDYLKNNKQISNKSYRELFGISHKTAHIELTELVTNNIIKKFGQGRSTAYSLK